METRRSRYASSVARTLYGLRSKKGRKGLRNLDFRSLAVEPLEERQLLAILLQSVIPNEGTDLLVGGVIQPLVTLNTAPREFTFKFSDGQIIDPNSLLGIRILGSGGDGTFTDGNEIDVDPLRAGAGTVPRGFVGIGNFSNEVVLRFAETLPDDLYQIIIIGDSSSPALPPDPLNPTGVELQNTAAEPYNLGTNSIINLDIDRGTQIVGVVPQPVRRVGAGLVQDRNLIEVYFNANDPPSMASAETEAFYDLIFTGDSATTVGDVHYTPVTATYVPAETKVVLDFGVALHLLGAGQGTYRLRVGNDALPITTGAPVATAEIGNDFTTVTSVGTLTGVQSTINTSAIDPDGIFLPGLPGNDSDPGNRQLPYDLNTHGGGGGGGSSVSTFQYNFDIGPITNSAGTFFNNITENQKQRAREVFALYSYYTGIHFEETASSGFGIWTSDMRASDPLLPPVGGPAGISGDPIVINETLNFGISQFGGTWFSIAMHEIGHNLGLGHSYELTSTTIQGDGSPLDIGSDPVFPGDHDITHIRAISRPDIKDIDLYRFQLDAAGKYSVETIAERLAAHAVGDQLDSLITLYEEIDTLKVLPTTVSAALDGRSFTINDSFTPTVTFVFDSDSSVIDSATTVSIDFTLATTPAQLAAAIAAAINNPITALRSDAKVDGDLVKIQGLITLAPDVPGTFPLTHKVNVRDMVARNEDYYSEDSFLELRLDRGIFYVAVTSSGNDQFDPEIANSGNGGHTQGNYTLRMNFVADTFNTIVDADNPLTPTQLDGDGDGRPGGLFNFWFKVADEVNSHTIFVDKAEPGPVFDGSEANPYNTITAALARLAMVDRDNTAPGEFDILRIVGNGGSDSNLSTAIGDTGALTYEIGVNSSGGGDLPDGRRLDIPRGVTAMIDAGAIFKLRQANITAGSTAQGVNRSEGHLQVLGTPQTQVYFTSFHDETIGFDSQPLIPTVQTRGDWGGLVFRNDLDFAEMNIPSAGSRRVLEQAGAFLNVVNGADIGWGGGQVTVNSQSNVYQPIYMDDARPTVTHNTITNSSDAAMSADPFSFTDEKFQNNLAGTMFTADYERIGPHIHDNRLATYTTGGALVAHNSLNGLVVRIRQNAGTPIDSLTGPARFDDTDITHILQENLLIQGTPGGLLSGASRIDARLKIDPGTVVKLEGARIELGFGAQLLAEGTDAGRVVFTSLRDDTWGFGGTFDTNGNFAGSNPLPGNWGGIFFGHTSTGSIDHAHISYGGGDTRIEGGSDRFNVIEIHQADVRIVNSTLQNNDDGTAATNRVNRQGNSPATIFVRGSQPVLVNNIIRDNDAAAININVNSLQDVLRRDPGRSTGVIDTFDELNDNYGPLVRLNRLANNAGGNGMNIRGGNLNVQSTWDDTDIVHILTQIIQVVDLQHYGGLKLQSSETASLVVKLAGATTAGFQATGLPLDVNDRVGGTIHIVGTPQFPVVLTSLQDDTVGAGFNPIGQPMLDTNNNGASTGTAGAWRSVRLDKYANDRNSAIIREIELPYTNGVEANGTANTSQFLGTLAKDQKSGDDNRRLGIEVEGTIAWDDTTDVDVYSFRGTAGSEVWLDLDFTTHALDSVVELVLNDGSDTVVARSINSVSGDTFDATGFITNASLAGNLGRRMDRDAFALPNGTDFYTTNPRDAGMRLILPGSVGTEETYFVRVRSNSPTINTVKAGISRGAYTLQIRTRELDEFPGSTIRFADLRFGGGGGQANSASIELFGVPYHSYLVGESRETTAANDAIGQAQVLGNLQQQERNTIGVSGSLSGGGDVDWYNFNLNYLEIQSIPAVNGSDKSWSTVLDVDYANGLTRGDTNLAVFDRTGGGEGLIFFGSDSNVSDDQPDPLAGSNTTDLSRGSFGTRDPFIGPIHLPSGGPTGAQFDYRAAMSSNERMPTALNQYYVAAPAAVNVRLEPINSVNRIAEDRVGYQEGSNIANQTATELFTGTDGITLGTHAVPFTLSDVTLFVNQGSTGTATDGRLFTVDPYTGDQETDLNNIGGAAEYLDIEMRDDGRLVGLRAAPVGANSAPATAGNLDFIDTGNATIANQGDDGIDIIQLEGGPPPAPVTQGNRAVRYEAWAYTGNGFSNNRFLFAVGRIVGNANGGATALTAAQTQNVLYRMNPNTGVADQGAAPGTPAPPSQRQPISGNGITGLVGGTTELVTGMEFLGGTMYIATDAGRLYTLNTTSAVATPIAGGAVVGLGGFNGLTKGPRNVENAAYRNLLFTISSTGLLRAYSIAGVQQTIFDTDGNGILETSASTGISNAAGLSFSNVDYNMWHFTDVEPGTGANATLGHGIGTAPDNSVREDEIADNGANGSFYFGLENNDRNTILTLDLATTQPDSQHFITGNPAAYNTFNVPGGAHGALTTNSFSLEGYATEDKPTLYFTYFLQTEGAQANGVQTTMRDAARVHISTDGGLSWDMVATNNSAGDPDGYNPPTMITTSDDSELPEFDSWSENASDDPRQRIQELYDTNNWRQARIDLGEYAGETTLMLRFDFSTAGDISDPSAPAGSQYAIGMTGDAFGNFNLNLQAPQRGQNNAFRGFHVDDIIVGFAERGEMVLNAPADVLTHFTANVDPTPDFFTLISGEYQLEIRRGPEYGTLDIPILPDLTLAASYDTNDRHVQDFTLTVPASASFADGQTLSVSDGVNLVVFTFRLAPSLSTDISIAAATNSTMATRITTAINNAFGGRVTAKRVASSSSYTLENPKVDIFHAARVTETSALTVDSFTTGVFGFGIEGDRNQEREQGMVLVEQNRVTNSAGYAITLDEGARDNGGNTPHPGSIHHLRQLNINQQWVPSAVVENNVLAGGTLGGILVSGDPNPGTVSASIPFARILNNTIFGAATAIGVGIDVTQRASPTILNNIVSNLQTGVRIDATSQAAGAVMQGTAYKSNGTNANTGGIGVGSFAIQMTPTDALFVSPLTGNFYLAAGSLAIDSSIENLGDRPELINIYTAAGISQSNILAPEFDAFGNRRVDDPTVSPVALGLGANVFIDRGALERVNTLTINDVTVVEGNAGTVNAVFTVTLTRTSSDTVTVEYNTTDGDAVFGADYLPAGGVLTFFPGQTEKFITVVVNGDVVDEANEVFFVNLFNETAAVVADVQGIGTINDDDPLPSVSVLDSSALEGDVGTSPMVFQIVMSPPSGRSVTVNFTTAVGTATAADFNATAGAVVFSPGEGTKFVTVQIIGDATVEPNETFFLNLTGATNATIVDNSAIGTIQDNDLKLSISDGNPFPVTEPGAGTVDVVFSVTLSGPSATAVTVVYTANTGSGAAGAIAGTDFQSNTNTLTFVPGDVQEFVTVRVVADLIDELNETFTVDLTNAVNAAIQDSQGLGEIVDDAADLPPALSISNVSLTEGDSGLKNFVFNVTLNVPSGKVVTVAFATADGPVGPGGATQPSDYLATSGTLTFNPGVSSLPITVQVVGDTTFEGNETFFVNLASAVNASIANPQGNGIIAEDEPRIDIADVTVTEGDSLTVNAIFTVTLDKVPLNDIIVTFTTADDTAEAAQPDYDTTTGILTFDSSLSETMKTFTVVVHGDTVPEDNESFEVNLTNNTPLLASFASGGDQAIGTIIDDEAQVYIREQSTDSQEHTVTEGNGGMTPVVFDVLLTKVSTVDVTVVVSAADGTALAAQPDYSFTSQTLTFSFMAGETSKTVTAQVVGDLVNEGDETFTVDLSSPVGALIVTDEGTATITIDDDDAPTRSSIATIAGPGGSTVTEGDSPTTTNATFLISLNAPSGLPVTVFYATANNSAAAGSDFTSVNTSVVFAPGETTKIVTVSVTGDNSLEPDETYFVNISSTDAVPLAGQSQAVGGILDDEPRAHVEGGGTVAEGGQVVFQIILDKTPTTAVTVNYNTANGTAIAGSDYTAVSGSEVFTAGTAGAGLTRNITVQTTGDVIDEFDETFTLNISGVANLVEAPSSATATIVDDDGEPTISILGTSTAEGDSGTSPAFFIVSLSAPSGKTITVQYATANITAQSGLDYNSTTGTLTFTPTQTQQTITVQVLGDLLGEQDETYSVVLSNPTNATGTPSATGTIVDNEPRLSIADAVVLEGDAPALVNADFVVSLSKPSDSPVQVTITYATSDGTATSPADYTGTANSTLIFSPGQTVKSLLVPITGDLLNEGNETFTVNVTSVTNALVVDGNALGTIVDNDPLPALRVFDASVAEGTGGLADMVFRVTLTPASGRTVTVNYATADDVPLSATAGADYGITSGSLVFAAGVTELFVTVPITTDNVGEPNETFRVDLSSPSFATLADSQAIGTILDDEPRIVISDVTVDESQNAVFTISLVGAASGDVSVGYATADGTAVQPGDYTAAASAVTFTFSLGETTKQITVAIVNDGLDENPESFFVNLSSPSSTAVIQDAQGVGTITDNDNPPTVSILDVSVTEGNGGTIDAVFAVQLSGPSGLEVRVPFTVDDGSATLAGNDYFDNAGTVTFAPMSVIQFITVQVRGDALGEPDENFLVNLGTPVNATLADGQGIGTIGDDEPRISIGDPAAIPEGDAGSQNLVFTVFLNQMYFQPVTVAFTTANGTAVSPADYTSSSGTITFAINQTTQVITIAVQGDQLDELDETFFVNLSNASANSVILDGQGVGTITDLDNTPTVSISDTSVNEGSSGTVNALFPVTLSAASGLLVTVVYSTANGTATAGSDYVGIANATLTFNPGETSKNIPVTVNGDLSAEQNETFFVNFSGAGNATIADGSAQGTIIDNEPRVTILPASVLEGDFGTVQMEFVVQLSKASGQPIQVVYSTEVGGGANPATPGVDYTAVANATLVFNPGQVVRSIFIPVLGDTLDEEDETFQVRLNSAFNAIIQTDLAGGTIVDNDALPFLTINDVSVTEGNAGTTNAVFTVTLSAASGRTVTVAYATADGTATLADNDYATASGVLTFPAGVTTQQITVAVVGDSDGEPNETFLVNLSAPTNATLADVQGVGTIGDDEPRIVIADLSVNENAGNAVFTVSLVGAASGDVTVAFNTADGTATLAGSDYTATAGVLTFSFLLNETAKQVTVVVNSDALDENNETFFVNLSSPSINAVIGDPQGIGTIVDDDGVPTVTITDVAVTEGNGGTVDAVFTVQLSNASGLEVRVPFSTADGAATLTGNDYFASTGTVTFAPGIVNRTITVQVRGDTLGEPNENFLVNLGTPTNATLADNQAVGTINDDEPRITILDPTAITEGDTGSQNLVFEVQLDRMYSQAVTVAFATANGTATSPADYASASGTITFAINQTQQFITVAVQGDLLDELDETFVVNLSTSSLNAVIADGQGVGTITDNDGTPTLNIFDVSVTEGQVGTVNALFPVTLSAASGLPVTVVYSTANDTATAGSDYIGITGATLTFNAGETSKNITVAVNGDTTAEQNETFFVNLGGAINASITDSQAVGTIGDDEPRASVIGVTVTEGDAGSVQAQFQITLNRTFSQPVTVTYMTDVGTGPALATAGADYTAIANATVTFNPGETVKSVFVPVLGDLLNEDPETFSLRLTAATNAILLVNVAEGRILDNDPLPVMTISDVSVTEGNAGNVNAVLTVSLSAPSGRTVGVAYATANGTATTADGDYLAASGNLLFNPGQVSQQITVAVVGDTRGEPNETVLVNLSAAFNATLLDAQGVVTIGDDEPRVSIDDITITETEAAVTGTFTVSLSGGAASGPVTVVYSTAAGTATADVDYTSITGGTVTFLAGESAKPITVTVLGDTLDENSETFLVNLVLSTNNAVLVDGQGQATILDNDAAPTISIADTTVAEGNIGTTDAVFRVSLSAPSGLEVQVPFSTANNTATVSGSDYNANTGVVTFTAGTTEQFITVQVRGDTLGEPDETFLVNLATPVNATLGDGQAIGTIDDDEPRISVNDVSVNEADTTVNLVFTVTLDVVSSGNVTVVYSTSPLTATAGVDYTSVGGTLTFQSGIGETIKTVTVQITGDDLDEADETFQINLSGPSANAVILDGQGTGTIVDDDGLPSLSIGDASVNEGNSGAANLVFPVTLSAPSGQTVSVQISSADGTATLLNGDYVAYSGGPVVFSPGETQKNVTVQVIGDRNAEPNETLFVNLSAPSFASIADGQGQGTILDDEPFVSIDPVTVTEGNADVNAVFVVRMDRASTQTVAVTYSTQNGTAVAPGDYTAVGSGTVSFAPGQVQALVTVTVRGDFLNEPTETFSVTLGPVTTGNATSITTPAVGTILNDDPLPSLSIGTPAAVDEGNSTITTTPLRFPVTMSSASGQEVTVVFSTSDGTAMVAGLDYNSASGTLTFAPGETSKEVVVQVRGDTVGEPNETFLVQLQSPVNASVSTSLATGTILDDEPRVSINNIAITETESAALGIFTVSLDRIGSGTVLVVYSTAPGTATADVDYASITGGTVTFLVGESSKPITVTALGDSLDENNETFLVNLALGTNNAVLLDGQGEATILDNDPLPQLSINDASVVEGDAGTTNMVFNVTLAAASGRSVTVNYTTTAGTATAGTDFTQVSGAVSFAPGSTQQQLTVPIVGDLTGEFDETFSVSLSAAANATIADGVGQGTILDDDARLQIGDAVVTEINAGTVAAVFSVTLTEVSPTPISVLFSTANGTALAGPDYQAASGSLSFAAGNTQLSVTVNVQGDFLDELDETFFVNLTSPVGTVIIDGQGQGTILDNDPSAALAINSVSVTEGDTPNVANAVFTVTLTPASGRDVTVEYLSTPVSATQNVDYSPVSGTLTFAAGQTQQQITVQVIGDLLAEFNETFQVSLVNAANANITTATGTGTILDDEPRLSISDVTVTEIDGGSNEAIFTVSIDRTFPNNVTVAFVTANGTAAAGSDYTGTGGTLTIVAGSTSAQVTVSVLGDVNEENNETFFVNLSAPVGAILADNQGQATILDNDPLISINNVTVTEGTGAAVAAVFTVTLSQTPETAVTVNFVATSGTATSGTDFSPAGGALTFGIGETQRTITVNVLGDSLNEAAETFNVTLSGAVNGQIQPGGGVGTILDNDPLPAVQINNISVTEGGPGTNNTAIFSLTLSAVSGQVVTVNVATAVGNGSASSSDFVASSGTITFAPGTTTAQATVQVVGDATVEPNETFVLNLSNPVNATIPFTFGTATIINDDVRHVFVTGADAGGGPHVKVFDTETGVEKFGFMAYGTFGGGVRVAAGDVNGDGVQDVVTVPGAGGGPHLRVINGVNGQEIYSLFAIDSNAGLQVAMGDVNRDGRADIIIGTDGNPGDALARVRVFNGPNGALLAQYNFDAASGLNTGIRVAAGDVDGDGDADLILGSGPGVPSRVIVRDALNGTQLTSFSPYAGFTGGIYVTGGDTNLDGRSEIITGAGAGGGPHVRVFDGASVTAVGANELFGFNAYNPAFGGGVRVAATDYNADGRADIVTAAGPGGGPHIRILSGVNLQELRAFFAYPNFTGGVFVGGSFRGVGAALQAASPAAAGGSAASITSSDVLPLVQRAIADWAAAGLDQRMLDRLASVEVRIAELPGEYLATASHGAIMLDSDAAGHGWFVDSTPWSDEEFELMAEGTMRARQESAAAGMDLMTALAHELGHILGLGHEEGVMEETLATGTRRMPTAEDVDGLFAAESWD